MTTDLTGKFCPQCKLWERKCVCSPSRRGLLKRVFAGLGLTAMAALPATAAAEPKKTHWDAAVPGDRPYLVVHPGTGDVVDRMVKSADVRSGEILVWVRSSDDKRIERVNGSLVLRVLHLDAFDVVEKQSRRVVASYRA